jgi:hypothetical protein
VKAPVLQRKEKKKTNSKNSSTLAEAMTKSHMLI